MKSSQHETPEMNGGEVVEPTREQLHRYDVSAPRYTSYPPVPYWGELDSDQASSRLAIPSERADSSLSLYIHIPFCVTRCLYCGCFVIITPRKSQGAPYLEAVKREMKLVRDRMEGERPVRQFHLGGGTPTFISKEEMADLVKTASGLFPFDDEPEMSIEVDPRTVSRDYLEILRELGFNRISLGVQDFDPKVMETVNREQPYELVAAIVEAARELEFKSVNFDLIYGLPYQTLESFTRTMDQVHTLSPDRLAIYNYAHLPDINPYQRKISDEALPGAEEKTTIFLEARRLLSGWGYRPIGLDHFAKPSDDLTEAFDQGTMRRNFMGYTTQAGTDMLAFGISSISEFNNTFWQNEKKLNRYYQFIQDGQLPIVKGMVLSGEDIVRKSVISALFCEGGLDYEKFEQSFGYAIRDQMSDELEALKPLADDGLITLEEDRLRINPMGQLFLRNIAMVFDPYLRKKSGGRVQFSRAL